MIEVEEIKVKYGDFVALEITTPIRIETGDRIGIIGGNGSGKSTFINAILGLVPYQGVIKKSISNEEIAVHLQENNYVDTMKIKYIMEGILNTKIKDNQRLQEVIKFFEFEKCLDKKYKKLSGGQKQRFTIIMVLLQDAKFTCFDEVTSGLDFETRQSLMNKIKQWYQDKDASICIVSHYFEELELLVNKILIIEQGKVIAYGTPDALFNQYCGNKIIIIDANDFNRTLVSNYQQILSPEHLIVINVDTDEDEVVKTLLEHNINFKISKNDLEIMYYNAIKSGGAHNV